jgi:hypothetical protein
MSVRNDLERTVQSFDPKHWPQPRRLIRVGFLCVVNNRDFEGYLSSLQFESQLLHGSDH